MMMKRPPRSFSISSFGHFDNDNLKSVESRLQASLPAHITSSIHPFPVYSATVKGVSLKVEL